MVSIDEIILRSITPFDNFLSVNFWYKQQQPEPTVDSIHQEVIAKIEAILDQVAQNHHTPTVILDGDASSGKIYLLGRLKKKFNHKAFLFTFLHFLRVITSGGRSCAILSIVWYKFQYPLNTSG